MSAKEQAILDIKEELEKQHKCFIAFRTELNPIMRKIVRKQIMDQKHFFPFRSVSKSNSQLMATCLFCKGEVRYDNYTKYYER